MLKPHVNRLAMICADIRDSELKIIVKSIHQYIQNGVLDKDAYFRKFVDAINAKYDIPKDYRMIEHAVLLEAARRFSNQED